MKCVININSLSTRPHTTTKIRKESILDKKKETLMMTKNRENNKNKLKVKFFSWNFILS